MRVGQLWYGWAPRGVEGVNQEQVVAGSGGLAQPANPLTQRVLPWLYYTTEPSFGWIEHHGVGVAFQRTPTGRDASGRLGAFFVHALVWQAGTLPFALLGQLHDARLWVTEPPPEPPAELPPLTSADAFRLGPPQEPAPEDLRRALAGFLRNASRGRRTALGLPSAPAARIAARIAVLLPQQYGLLSFSTFEREDRAAPFALIGGPAPSAIFDGIELRDADAAWRGAADVLLEASQSAEVSASVASLARQAPKLRDFAALLHRWASVAYADATSIQSLGPEHMALLANDPVQAGKLLDGVGVNVIADLLAKGRGPDVFFAAARQRGLLDELARHLAGKLERQPIDVAWAVLEQVGPHLDRAIASLAVPLAQSWARDGALDQLDPDAALRLALCVAETTPQAEAAPIRERLARRADLCRPILASELPRDWRVAAATAHVESLDPLVLARAVSDDGPFGELYLAATGPAGAQALTTALQHAPLVIAERAAEHLASSSADPATPGVVWPVVLRLASARRLWALERWAPANGVVAAEWAAEVLTAYVETLLECRAHPRPLAPIGDRAMRLEPVPVPEGWQRWQAVRAGVAAIRREGASGGPVDVVLRHVRELPDPRHRDAALELVVDACAGWRAPYYDAWRDALERVQVAVDEQADVFTARVGRAALRSDPRIAGRLALNTVLWIADGLDTGALSAAKGRLAPFERLHELLLPDALVTLDGRLRRGSLERPARKWLEHHSKELKKRTERGGKRLRIWA